MSAQLHDETASRWANHLGLALSELFSAGDRPFGEASHFALLDGATASFGLTVDPNDVEDSSLIASYAWSSNLRKHVVVCGTHASVLSTARPKHIERYSLATIDGQLDRFLEYLSQDRQAPTFSVVEHVMVLLDRYRQAAGRSLGPDHDQLAMHALLLDLALKSNQNLTQDTVARRLNIRWAQNSDLQPLIDQVRNSSRFDPDTNQLWANLAIRHAGGAIFQRLTAALTLLPQLELFSGEQASRSGTPQSLRMGGYFTPAGLARSLAEASIRKKLHLPVIRICDPACGSGVFLSEALRALDRAKFRGRVQLVGRDVLPIATEIAQFVVGNAASDFGSDRVDIDISSADSMDESFGGNFDIVLMNPPYRAWEQSSPLERERVRNALGRYFGGRPDLSLAFANKAFESLSETGVLAALLPVGVLSADYSRSWREGLCEQAAISLIGTLGDHYLFDYAMVNVAMVIIEKMSDVVPSAQRTALLWASQDPRSSSHALRALRKSNYQPQISHERDDLWRIYQMRQSELALRANWAPTAHGSESVIAALRSSNFPVLGELFKVRQGIRTGSRAAFVLSSEQLSQLPEAEQQAFRPVAEKDGISEFEVKRESFVFYAAGLREKIANEAEFRDRFGTYYHLFIEPNKEALARRPRGVKLWELSWSRAWLVKPEPKLVSRMFLGRRQLGFAVDETGDLAVVQGYGWEPVWKELSPRASSDRKLTVLYAYAFIFSSDLFYDLVRTVSVNIAGGQYDLAPKYINQLPVPSWSAINSVAGSRLENLESARELASVFRRKPEELERFARACYSIGSY